MYLIQNNWAKEWVLVIGVPFIFYSTVWNFYSNYFSPIWAHITLDIGFNSVLNVQSISDTVDSSNAPF